MVGHNPQFTYRKDGVFYFSRRIPKDIRHKYEHDRFVMCLRTKSRVVADKSSRAIAARLDEYWMSLRIADLNIPSMLPVNGQVTTFGLCANAGPAMQSSTSIFSGDRTLARGTPPRLRTAPLTRPVRPEPPLDTNGHIVFLQHDHHPAYEVLKYRNMSRASRWADLGAD